MVTGRVRPIAAVPRLLSRADGKAEMAATRLQRENAVFELIVCPVFSPTGATFRRDKCQRIEPQVVATKVLSDPTLGRNSSGARYGRTRSATAAKNRDIKRTMTSFVRRAATSRRITGRDQLPFPKDEWTTATKDRSLSAQFEQTVSVTETRCRYSRCRRRNARRLNP